MSHQTFNFFEWLHQITLSSLKYIHTIRTFTYDMKVHFQHESIGKYTLEFTVRTLKCSWRRAEERLCVRPSHVISPRLRMLLWREINVNTAHCEHPCNSLQPFFKDFRKIPKFEICIIILGSFGSIAVSKARSAICCSKLSSESTRERIAMHSENLRIDAESFLDASIYFLTLLPSMEIAYLSDLLAL